jgi:hypothetical protein
MSEKQPEPTDYEFPQLWENYAQLLTQRQRMLQSAMAFYVSADISVKALYDCELKLGLPFIDHVPETVQGKNALSKFTSVSSAYTTILNRFKDTYNF